MKQEVILSDGLPCTVRQLGLFDLDGVGPELPGPFTYTYTLLNGREITEVYPLENISIPPVPPDVPEEGVIEGTPNWHAMIEWQTYRAAISYEHNIRHPAIAYYVQEMSDFIVRSTVDLEDIKRIQTVEDWDAVYKAAVVPQITVELLAQTFVDTFSAKFSGEPVFEALQKVIKSAGEYDALRIWEHKAMSEYGFQTEENWVGLSLAERARKTASIALPELMSSLESDRNYKEQMKEAARNKKK